MLTKGFQYITLKQLYIGATAAGLCEERISSGSLVRHIDAGSLHLAKLLDGPLSMSHGCGKPHHFRAQSTHSAMFALFRARYYWLVLGRPDVEEIAHTWYLGRITG